jgi:homoaconitase/3-isopropylmalate dehydratase large subunit
MIEEGFALPGNLVVGADSHTNTYGAFGCFATGLGSTEIAVAWATGKLWFRVPETVHVRLEGTLGPGVYAKDVMLRVARELGMDGATYASLEISGPLIERLPMHERIIFANMSTELGAKCGLISPDDVTFAFLEAETRARPPFRRLAVRTPRYAREVTIDATGLDPQVACHPRVDTVRPIGEVAGQPIDQVFIGTCTNGRYEDLALAARLLRGRKVSPWTRTIVTPASQRVADRLAAEGLLQVRMRAAWSLTGRWRAASAGTAASSPRRAPSPRAEPQLTAAWDARGRDLPSGPSRGRRHRPRGPHRRSPPSFQQAP